MRHWRKQADIVGVADRLREDYHDAAFARPEGRFDREFEVHAERRLSLRLGVLEDGLRLWLIWRQPPDVLWWPLRRRPLMRRTWTSVDTLERVDAAARAALEEYLGTGP